MTELVIGLDVGTSSTKAVATTPAGEIVATAVATHAIGQPRPGWFEQDAALVWRDEALGVLRALTAQEVVARGDVRGIAVSGMGPCVTLADAAGEPMGPGILYGIDSRATDEIAGIEALLGRDRILERCGSALSSQALGPKLLWLRRHAPELWQRAAHWFGPASLLVHALTGEYVLDHHTASQCDPFYDLAVQSWAEDWIAEVCGRLPMPNLAWSTDIVGTLRSDAATAVGLAPGVPVLAGTVDAWAEAHSVGVRAPGDLLLMYGSTMFMIGVTPGSRSHPGLWRTAGVTKDSPTLAAGMSTSGLLTAWIAETTGRPLDELSAAAATVSPGADGLVLLPYFAGERSPLFDPGARGVLLGLQLQHGPAHLMRAAYEAIAMGVRHVLESFDAVAGQPTWRLVAAGGGASADTWTQIVSDVTGCAQHVPKTTIGAAYGDALLAATATGVAADGADWTECAKVVQPNTDIAAFYDQCYGVFRDAYTATRPLLDRIPLAGSTSPPH